MMLPSWATQRQMADVDALSCRKVSSQLSMLVVVPSPSTSPCRGIRSSGKCSRTSPWIRSDTVFAMVRSATRVSCFGPSLAAKPPKDQRVASRSGNQAEKAPLAIKLCL